MSGNARIDLTNVDMYYPSKVYNATTIRQELFALLKLEKRKKELDNVHALKNIDLHIKPGERVGVIGRNGSGKSTLLKTIAGVYPIESGDLTVEGKIMALFDIILGFDLESTGRENIMYRGLLLGATPDEIRERTQEIIDFSELGDFIEYPIKTYSSGMLVRLAFSVSTSLPGQILLLDEVIAAGDLGFIGKAQKRMMSLIDEAEMMVFVTHNLDMAQEICNRIVLLNRGVIIDDGKPEEVINHYKAIMESESDKNG